MKRFCIAFMVTTLLGSVSSHAQDWKTLGVDDLFQLAREKVFNGQREEGRKMLQYILEKSPGYHDVRVMLGRTYAWDGMRDAARKEFETVLAQSSEELDALNALTDVEMWDDQYSRALVVADRGLKTYPNNEDLLYKRASILNSLNRQQEALLTLNKLLLVNPAHNKGMALLKSIKSSNMKWTAGVSYGVDFFSRTFDPAQYASAQLGKTSNWGSATLRVNHTHRFSDDGLQVEADLYPKIADGVYAYLNYGYSGTALFPLHRAGAELFSKLPANFEASAGARYLYFDSGTRVTIFTGSIGWYVKSYWLSLRPYVTPDKETGTSISGSLTVRKYFSDAETYISLSGGLGFSPDLRRIQSNNGLSDDAIYLLHAQRAGITFQKLMRADLFASIAMDFARQELIFDADNYVVITSLGIAVRKRF